MKLKVENYTSPFLDNLFDNIDLAEYEKTRKMMALAAKIADVMEAKGWKKIDFAKAMNKKPSVITRWLSGCHNFSFDTLVEIERVLGIRLLDLSTETQKEKTAAAKEIMIVIHADAPVLELRSGSTFTSVSSGDFLNHKSERRNIAYA